MSIDDAISDYNSYEGVYNKYISELEELSKSKDNTQEKCTRIFESCRTQLKEITPSVTSGAPPDLQVKELLSLVKEGLRRKTCELAKQLVKSELNLLNPEVFKSFSHSLRLEIAKSTYDDMYGRLKYPLLEMLNAYGIIDPDEICEVAEAVAAKSAKEISEIISKLGITDINKRFKIAKIAAAQGGEAVTTYIKDYGLTDENMRFEIAKIVAAHRSTVYSTAYDAILMVEKCEITDQKMLFEIAKTIAKTYPTELVRIFQCYSTIDENKRFEIIKIAAAQSGAAAIDYIKYHGIADENKCFEIIKIAAAQNGAAVTDYMKDHGIAGENKRFEIIKIAAAQNGAAVTDYMKYYGGTDENMRFEIAKIAAAEHNRASGECAIKRSAFKNFGLGDPQKIMEILAIIAPRNLATQLSYLRELGGQFQMKVFIPIIIENWGWEAYKLGVNDLDTLRSSLNTKIDDDKKITLIQSCFDVIASKAQTGGDFDTLKALVEFLSSLFPSEISLRPKQLIVKVPVDYMSWISSLCGLAIPPNFETEDEESKVKKQLQESLDQLKSLAVRSGMPDKIIEPILNGIKGRRSLQQQKKDLMWLGVLVTHYVADPNPNALLDSPLCNEMATPLVKSIWEITDPTLRETATSALISIYSNPEKKEILKACLDERKKHLNLVTLFSVQAGVQKQAITELLKELSAGKYKDTAVITPIIGIIYSVVKSDLLSIEKKQELLKIVFNIPVKGDREPKPRYNSRLDEYRQEQTTYISALHTLLFFGQEPLLENVKDTKTLISTWQAFMGKTFYVKADALSKFMDTFSKSPRYPNGLITYATRLQTLPNDEKKRMMPFLGKFATSVLDGTFPQMRYDFSENPHLKTLFSNDKELLEKWQKSLPSIKIDRTAQETVSSETPQEQVQRLTRQALGDHHLGEDQDSVYPELEAVLSGATTIEILPNADVLEQKRINIMQKCTVLLNPKSNLPQLKRALSELQELLPNDVQFKQDVNDILRQLATFQSRAEHCTVEDTDSWEDMLLMGTEVYGSCQSITGDPSYNKCLLAYALDGKNRMIIARDSLGRIVGRVVLRILWDKARKKQVLFMERLYTRGKNYQSLQRDIFEGCKQKAQSMEIPLVVSIRDYKNLKADKYPGALQALGGPAPYEYVDALGGIQNNGIYSIDESYLLWSPEAAPKP